jgi:hypothetical protein
MAFNPSPVPLSQRVSEIPARDLSSATKLCDPYTPLDAVVDGALRIEFDRWRGGARLVRIGRNIRRAGSTPTLHFLSGHMGCGKTTELRRLVSELERHDGSAALPVRVIYVDADNLLDQRDIEVEDILLAVWGQLARLDIKAALPPLRTIWQNQIQQQAASFGLSLPEKFEEGFTKLLGQIKLAPPDQKAKVRGLVASNAQAIVRGINEAFEAVRGDDGATVIALFIDNLEKLALAERKTVEHLYLNRLGTLKQLAAHLVITVPLFLAYSAEGGGLTGLWGGETVILPMVKVRQRRAADDGGPVAFVEGVDAVAEMLCKRVEFATLFASGVAAAKRIAALSGGCLRHALRLTTLAMDEHDQPKVADASIEKAADILAADFDRALEERLLPVLMHVARTNEFSENCDPDIKRALLRNLFVLEYQNGDPAPWHGVHPLVERVRRFERAMSQAAK